MVLQIERKLSLLVLLPVIPKKKEFGLKFWTQFCTLRPEILYENNCFIVICVPWVISSHIYHPQVEKSRIGRFLWSFIHKIVFLAQNSTPFCPIGPKISSDGNNFYCILFPEWFLATFAFYRSKKNEIGPILCPFMTVYPKKMGWDPVWTQKLKGDGQRWPKLFSIHFPNIFDRNWPMILKLYQCKVIN